MFFISPYCIGFEPFLRAAGEIKRQVVSCLCPAMRSIVSAQAVVDLIVILQSGTWQIFSESRREVSRTLQIQLSVLMAYICRNWATALLDYVCRNRATALLRGAGCGGG